MPRVSIGTWGHGGTKTVRGRPVGWSGFDEVKATAALRRAYEIGLISAIVAPDGLLDEAKTMIRRVTKNGPVAVRMALESMYRALDTTTADALDYESSLFGILASTGDMREGMEAFMEKRKPEFKGR